MKDGRLEASDLMVGDWVDVRCDAAPNTPHIERITPAHFLRDEIWLPIHLNKEILEKNGWSQEIYSNESYDNEDIECLSLWVGEDGKNAWWWHAGFELVIPLNYVHEFQHALKLCGITREIII